MNRSDIVQQLKGLKDNLNAEKWRELEGLIRTLESQDVVVDSVVSVEQHHKKGSFFRRLFK